MKKGFTLIELLAVIVILAIIALIAMPIVLNIISGSRESSLLNSGEFYLGAVKYSIANQALKETPVQNGTYKILPNGNICLKYAEDGKTCANELGVSVKGDKPTGGFVKITGGKVSDATLELHNKIMVKNSAGKFEYLKPVCTVAKPDGTIYTAGSTYAVGDIVTCGSEKFFLISHKNKEIKMLAQKNINATGTGEVKQIDNAGRIAFASNFYWADSNDNLLEKYGTSYPTFVYDSNSNLYSHIEKYNTYLNNKLNIKTLDISILSRDEYESAEDIIIDSGFYSPSYWLGSANDAWNVYYTSGRNWLFARDDSPNNATGEESGIRPVITISTSNIK